MFSGLKVGHYVRQRSKGVESPGVFQTGQALKKVEGEGRAMVLTTKSMVESTKGLWEGIIKKKSIPEMGECGQGRPSQSCDFFFPAAERFWSVTPCSDCFSQSLQLQAAQVLR
jgi:hypothetical protein